MPVAPIYTIYFVVALGIVGMLVSSLNTQRDLQHDYVKCIQLEAFNNNAPTCDRTVGAAMRAQGAAFEKIMDR